MISRLTLIDARIPGVARNDLRMTAGIAKALHAFSPEEGPQAP